MKQIIFEKLTVKEEKNIRAGSVAISNPDSSGCDEINPRLTCPPLDPPA